MESFEFFIIASAAVVFAGVSKGGFGSGAAFVAAAGLATVIDPGQAIGLMLPLLMLMDVTSLKPFWGQWLKKESLYLCLSGMPGVALGVWFYSLADADMLRLLIGVISLLFVLWQAIQAYGFVPRAKEKLPPWAGGLAGVAAGFTSFVSHAGGPPAAIYLLSAKPSKTEYQATTVIVFWVINIAKALPYSFLGLFTWETLKLDLVLAPFALLGVWLGVRAHHLISERFFFLLTYVLLVLTGVRLIWVALS
ncbi:MAG: sulfite exporter TauE/SafE family protein [Paracoccaceae bacterium]